MSQECSEHQHGACSMRVAFPLCVACPRGPCLNHTPGTQVATNLISFTRMGRDGTVLKIISQNYV